MIILDLLEGRDGMRFLVVTIMRLTHTHSFYRLKGRWIGLPNPVLANQWISLVDPPLALPCTNIWHIGISYVQRMASLTGALST